MAATEKKDPFAIGAGVPKIEGALRPKPKLADRISAKVIIFALAIIALMAGLFLAALDGMDKKPKSESDVLELSVQATPSTALRNKFDDVLTEGDDTKRAADMKASPSLPKLPEVSPLLGDLPTNDAPKTGSVPANQIPATTPAFTGVPPLGSAPSGLAQENGSPPLTPAQQAAEKAKQERAQRMQQARVGGLSSQPFGTGAPGQLSALNTGSLPQPQGLSPQGGFTQVSAQSPQSPPDTKDEFLQKANKEVPGYHPFVPNAALAPKFEVKTGSFIPMTLETSINSDLPGQITARVTEDVYDTITGCRMLIPAMSRMVGRYDSKIALGQGRMLVAWNTLVFPDGAELNLAGMQAYNTDGQAGLASDVDNHYWRMFGLTFGLSMITTGVQLSVPQPNPTTGGAAAPQTPAQILAASLSQQYGTLGAQIISRYMAVQPTLRNFAGERFIVMVPRTIVLPKVWRSRCQ